MTQKDLEDKLTDAIRTGNLNEIPSIINDIKEYIKKDVLTRESSDNTKLVKQKKILVDKWKKMSLEQSQWRTTEVQLNNLINALKLDIHDLEWKISKAEKLFGYDPYMVDNDPNNIPAFANVKIKNFDDKRKFHILMKYWHNMDSDKMSQCMQHGIRTVDQHSEENWMLDLKEQNPIAYENIKTGKWKL